MNALFLFRIANCNLYRYIESNLTFG